MDHGVRLRQMVLATSDLDGAVDAIVDRFDLSVSHRISGGEESHRAFGLKAAMLPIGDQFLEIVQPLDPGAPAARHLARLGEDGGYMMILHVPSIVEARARLDALGLAPIWQGNGGGGVEAMHLHPRDTGGTLLSLASPLIPGTWSQGGPDWEKHSRTAVLTGIAAARVAARDPDATAARWAAILGIAAAPGQRLLPLAQGVLEFVATSGVPHGPHSLAVTSRQPLEEHLRIGAFTIAAQPASKQSR